ncbi:MAG: TonB-dependent receptor [Bryobacter sp.]|nr:TonB-dependent receptor [Bryobacter sp.]
MRFVLLALFAAALLPAQSTFSSITGVITDGSGAVVPNVQVEVTNTRTGYLFSATSNTEGLYTFPTLPDGNYNLKATSSGFSEFLVKDILLAVRETRRINITLSLSATQQTIEVSGGATLIETESAKISDTKSREDLRTLPLTLRRAWDYVTMTPQIARTATGFAPSFAGTRNGQSEASIDGITIAPPGGGFGFGPIMDRTENLEELRVELSLNSAEFATPGGMNLISKGGTNQFHGFYSDYYSTPAFRARNPFQSQRSTGISHRMAFGINGPIIIPKLYNGTNKSFFAFTIEPSFGSPSTALITQNTPIAPWRNGDFSGLTTPVRDPMNNRTPFPNNQIPANRINATSRAIQDRFYSLPNFGNTNVFNVQNYREERLNPFQRNPTMTIRLDHRINDKTFVYGRFIGVYWKIPLFESIPNLTEQARRTRDMRSWMVSVTRTITPNILNEFRWGLANDHLPVESQIRGNQVAQELGLQGLAPGIPDVGGLTRINFVGLNLSALGVQNTCDPCFRDQVQQFTNTLTWTRGKHLIKAGLDFRLGSTQDFRQNANLFGSLTFNNTFTGFQYGDFLLGMPTQVSRAFPTVEFDRAIRTYAAFVQDDWRVTSRLTLNLGVRYLLATPANDKNGRVALFDPATSRIVVPDGSASLVSPLLPRSYVDVVEASNAGFSNKLITSDKNNWAPRFGFAYRLMDKTVLRGGYGIYYDNTVPAAALGATVPFLINEIAFQNPVASPSVVLPRVFPAAGAAGPNSITLPLASRTDLRVPFTQQYAFTIEHQAFDTGFRLSYTGTNTRQGWYRRDINQPVVDSRPWSQKPRPFPQYPAINQTENGAGHQYHGLSFEAQRRMKGGFAFQTSYSWAKDLGDLEQNEVPEDSFNRLRDKGRVLTIPTHRFNANMIYNIPFKSSSRFLNGAFRGWQLSNILTLESGQWITPVWTGPDPTGTRPAGNNARANVTIRPNILSDPNLDNPTVARWFDPFAFSAPTLGSFGTMGRGIVEGPGTNTLHTSISKTFVVKERVRIRLEGLATNLFNTPNYQNPILNITEALNPNVNPANVTSGRITAIMNRNLKFDSSIPRELQVQFRVEF